MAQHGFADVGVTQIAERAEVVRMTYFRYFGDKQEVFAGEQGMSDSLILLMEEAGPGEFARLVPLADAVSRIRFAVRSLCQRLTAEPVGVVGLGIRTQPPDVGAGGLPGSGQRFADKPAAERSAEPESETRPYCPGPIESRNRAVVPSAQPAARWVATRSSPTPTVEPIRLSHSEGPPRQGGHPPALLRSCRHGRAG
ncbi:helix-turn-helix domain-containing protein [Streptomyces sp. NPDC093544]|uniref:TetR/AcrR family transcriptional regulator n=1 Tax=Streptomyces sp. NPDC093544 TaxID=3155200 RepID=UPI003422947E